jgi:type VI protein secretion system component Hcp
MSLLMNMKMEGVTGESTSFKHKGWFEVISWNWGMSSNRKSAHDDGARTSLNEISVIKPIGIESIDIRLLFAQGKTIPRIDFNILPVTGKREVQKNYVDIKMEDVIIKSIVTGGSTEDNFFKEHITFIFNSISFECNRPVADDGDVEEIVDHIFGWNVSDNAEWQK